MKFVALSYGRTRAQGGSSHSENEVRWGDGKGRHIWWMRERGRERECKRYISSGRCSVGPSHGSPFPLARSESVPFGSRCSQRADEDGGVPGVAEGLPLPLSLTWRNRRGKKAASPIPHIDSLINRQIILTLPKSPLPLPPRMVARCGPMWRSKYIVRDGS